MIIFSEQLCHHFHQFQKHAELARFQKCISSHSVACLAVDFKSIEFSLSTNCQAGEAFVTLVTTDSYCMGAVVVARSLRRHGTTRSLVVLVTPNISEQSRWVTPFFVFAFLNTQTKKWKKITIQICRVLPGSPSIMCLTKSSLWTWWTAETMCTCLCWDAQSLASPLPKYTAGHWPSTANVSFWTQTHLWVNFCGSWT